jgi:hypothetical protein
MATDREHESGRLDAAEENSFPDDEFAFPAQRKEPLSDAEHVRNAIARFDQVKGVTDAERDEAWRRILAAAERYDVHVSESDWRDLFEHRAEREHEHEHER